MKQHPNRCWLYRVRARNLEVLLRIAFAIARLFWAMVLISKL